MRKSVTPWLVVLGVVPLTLTLTGCFGGPPVPNLPIGPDSAEDQQVDEMVEDMVEGSGDDLDYESGQLPADFPVDAVPLVPGEVLSAMSIGNGTAWTVTIVTADEATANSAASLLEAAGYTNDSVFAWENEEYLVVIVATQELDEGGWGVHYQVQVQS